MTKYNYKKSEIMKRAWDFKKKFNMSLSKALKMSWALAKDEKIALEAKEKETATARINNMSGSEYAEELGLCF